MTAKTGSFDRIWPRFDHEEISDQGTYIYIHVRFRPLPSQTLDILSKGVQFRKFLATFLFLVLEMFARITINH